MSKIRMLRKEAQVALPNSGETYTAEDGTISMVLDDEHNDNYEPNEQEIKDYAEWLGMELPADEELLWIAKEGLKAPLPKEWKPCKTDTAEVYYFNFKTGDSIWDHPMDDHFKRKFKTEKDRLARRKMGVEEETALSKLPQRSNMMFTESGVMRSEDTESNNSSTTNLKPSVQATKGSTLKGNGSFGSLTSATSSKVPSPIPEMTEKAAPASKFGVTNTKTGAGNKASDKGTKAAALTSSLGDSIPLPDSPDEMTLDDSLTPRNTATTAAVKRKKDRADLMVKAATATPTPTPTPTPDPKPVARITSEAEKALEAKVKKEMQIKLEEDMAKVARDVQNQIHLVGAKHKEAVAKARADHEASIKRIGRKIDAELDDELATKQRALEASTKAAITALQDEVDELRDSLKSLNIKIASAGSSSASDISEAVADIQRVSKTSVAKKVAAIEEEIDEIRDRHKKKQSDTISKAQQSMEEAVESASTAALRAAKVELNDKIDALEATHAAEVKRITRQAEEEMEAERTRIERSSKEQSSTLMAELAKRKEEMVKAASEEADTQVAALSRRLQSELDDMRTTHESAMARDRTKLSGGGEDVSEQVAALEETANRRRHEITSQFDDRVDAELSRLKDARRSSMEAARNMAFPDLSSAPSADDNGDAAVRETRRTAEADCAQREAALRDRYTSQIATLESQIQALELTVAKEDADRTAQEGDQAIKAALASWIGEVTDRRQQEERDYKTRKDDVLSRIEASRALGTPSSPTRRGNPDTPKREAANRARLDVENTFHDRARDLRNSIREQKSARSMEMVDALANDERTTRRTIDTDVASSIEAWKRTATKSMLQEVEDEVKRIHVGGGGVSRGTLDPSSDSADTEEEESSDLAPDSDDEQAVLATAHLPPVPNVAYEVQRRLKDIMLDYERREANLRASIRAGAPSAHMDPTLALALQSQQELLARQQSVQQARHEWRGGAEQHSDPALASMFGQLANMMDGMSNRVASLENSPVGVRRH